MKENKIEILETKDNYINIKIGDSQYLLNSGIDDTLLVSTYVFGEGITISPITKCCIQLKEKNKK